MPPKGKRSYDDITGGSGDYNPQWFSLGTSSPQSGVDGTTVHAVPLPIPRLKVSGDRQLVMELLRVKFIVQQYGAAVSINSYYMGLSTNPNIQPTAGITALQNDPRSIVDRTITIQVYSQVGFAEFPTSDIIDCTDSAGHGILLATDSIFFATATASTGLATFLAGCKFEYRFKEVSLSDYIGIVQGQQ